MGRVLSRQASAARAKEVACILRADHDREMVNHPVVGVDVPVGDRACVTI